MKCNFFDRVEVSYSHHMHTCQSCLEPPIHNSETCESVCLNCARVGAVVKEKHQRKSSYPTRHLDKRVRHFYEGLPPHDLQDAMRILYEQSGRGHFMCVFFITHTWSR